MATNFNTSGLATWTAADPTKALQLVILDGKGTKDHYSFRTGVKYQTKIPNITNVDVDISTGSISGYNTGVGQTTFEEVTLANTTFKIFETYTKEVLDTFILGPLGKGSDPANLPFEDIIATLKGKALFNRNEKLLWTGDVDVSVQGGGNDLTQFDGVLAQLSDVNDVGVVESVAGAEGPKAADFSDAGFTDASILVHVKILVNVMAGLKPEYSSVPQIMSMSPVNFATYARALYSLNGAIDKDTIGQNGQILDELHVPGTQIKVVSEIGLDGNNSIVLTIPENIIAVYDLEGEDEILDFIYNPYARWHELAGQYKLGLAVVDPSNCVVSLTTTTY